VLSSCGIVDCATYPVLRELVPQILSCLLYSGLITELLLFTNIVKCKGGYINYPVNLREWCYLGTESQSFRTHDRFIKAVIDHIKEPLLVSCIARQADLLSATLWRFSLGKIDACEVCPINYTDSSMQSVTSKRGNGWHSLTVLLCDRRRDPRSHSGVI
jgi:hypothetical protein